MSDWTYPRTRDRDGQLAEDPEWLDLAWAYAQLDREVFIDLLEDMPPSEQDEALRCRFRYDREWFLSYFWPEVYDMPFNHFQLWFLNRPSAYWRDRTRNADAPVRWATAAPRANAKTTLGKGLMCHEAIYGLEAYTVVISAGVNNGSKPIVQSVLAMLSENALLAEVYGDIKVTNHQDKKGITVGTNPPVGFAAMSFNTQVRGTAFGTQRPTKVVVDDGEHPDRVRNADNRTLDWDFLQGDILKAGPPARGGIGLKLDWVGTVLHRDSLLARLLKEPGYRGRKWQAITRWSEDVESITLWERCREIWADRTNDDSAKHARAFYRQNKAAMDKGWGVMDPTNWPLYELQVAIWQEGMRSFLRERQNEAALSAYSFFNPDNFSRFTIQTDHLDRQYIEIRSTQEGKPDIRSYLDEFVTKVGYLDPVPGKDLGSLEDGAGAGDYAAFAILGKDRYGYVYVLDVILKRARDSEQIQMVWEACEKWGLKNVVMETTGFDRLITRDFRRSQVERANDGLYASVKFIEDKIHLNKEARIATLEPVANGNGWLRFSTALSEEVMDQFADFPNASHDDGPDAVAGAFRALGGTPEREQPGRRSRAQGLRTGRRVR